MVSKRDEARVELCVAAGVELCVAAGVEFCVAVGGPCSMPALDSVPLWTTTPSVANELRLLRKVKSINFRLLEPFDVNELALSVDMVFLVVLLKHG